MNIVDSVAALGPGPLTEDSLAPTSFRSSPHARRTRHLSRKPFPRPSARPDRRRPARRLPALAAKLGDAWDGVVAGSRPPRPYRATHQRTAPRLYRPQSLCRSGPAYRTQRASPVMCPRVVATAAEFDSVDVILKQYAAVGRIHLQTVSGHASDGTLDLTPLEAASIRRRSRYRPAGPLHDRANYPQSRTARRRSAIRTTRGSLSTPITPSASFPSTSPRCRPTSSSAAVTNISAAVPARASSISRPSAHQRPPAPRHRLVRQGAAVSL